MKIDKNMKLWLFILLFLSCTVPSGGCKKTDELGRPSAFFDAPIYDEYKRIPIVFPFEINEWVGVAQLSRWEHYDNPLKGPVDADSIAHHILRFSQTNGHVFGECDRGWVYPSGELRYFVFSLSTTNLLFCSNKVEFAQQCATFGGDVRQMRPFEEQWKTYWEQHDKREKQSEKKRP
jgi:hypothetical protein